MQAWTLAAELPKVPLADGLALLLLARSKKYFEGYDPEHPERGGFDDGPIWGFDERDGDQPAIWEKQEKRPKAISD